MEAATYSIYAVCPILKWAPTLSDSKVANQPSSHYCGMVKGLPCCTCDPSMSLNVCSGLHWVVSSYILSPYGHKTGNVSQCYCCRLWVRRSGAVCLYSEQLLLIWPQQWRKRQNHSLWYGTCPFTRSICRYCGVLLEVQGLLAVKLSVGSECTHLLLYQLFQLSLMGTNLMDFVAEAWRVLRRRGRVKVDMWLPKLLCAMARVMRLIFFLCVCVCTCACPLFVFFTGVHVGGCSSPFTWHFDEPLSVLNCELDWVSLQLAITNTYLFSFPPLSAKVAEVRSRFEGKESDGGGLKSFLRAMSQVGFGSTISRYNDWWWL